MTVELLSIVEAEERAEKSLEEAASYRERILQLALEERERKLSSLKPISPRKITPPIIKPKLENIKKKSDLKKAVKKILEEFDALS